jgi:hypothetical protein
MYYFFTFWFEFIAIITNNQLTRRGILELMLVDIYLFSIFIKPRVKKLCGSNTAARYKVADATQNGYAEQNKRWLFL